MKYFSKFARVLTIYQPKTHDCGSKKEEQNGNLVKFNVVIDQIVEKESLEKTLEEFIVKDGDVFMVEVKFGDSWPRDPSS